MYVVTITKIYDEHNTSNCWLYYLQQQKAWIQHGTTIVVMKVAASSPLFRMNVYKNYYSPTFPLEGVARETTRVYRRHVDVEVSTCAASLQTSIFTSRSRIDGSDMIVILLICILSTLGLPAVVECCSCPVGVPRSYSLQSGVCR